MPAITILARLFKSSSKRGHLRSVHLAQLGGSTIGCIGPLTGLSHQRLHAFKGSFKCCDPGMFAPYVLSYGLSRARPYVVTPGTSCVLSYGIGARQSLHWNANPHPAVIAWALAPALSQSGAPRALTADPKAGRRLIQGQPFNVGHLALRRIIGRAAGCATWLSGCGRDG